jgi:hypothetical protein
MKTNSELLAYAYGIAESHFYSDDECEIPWEPFENSEKEQIDEEVNNLAESIYNAMLWAQS